MNNIFLSFMICLIAGMSTLFGVFVIFFKIRKEKLIAYSLSFASGVMLCVSIIDLIPESFKLISIKYMKFPTIILIMIFICIGVIFSMLIDKYIPSNDKLYRVGIISMLAIILHNIPEGIATFLTATNNISLGIPLSIAIALHNIPEGISISVPIFYATKSYFKAIFYTFISGASEPFGALIAYLFLKNWVNDTIMGFLFSFIAGIMIHISIYELIPQVLKYKEKLIYLFFIFGVLLMFISITLI